MINIDIIVDFDGVIANSIKAIHKVYQQLTGDNSTIHTSNVKWDLTDICPLWTPQEIDATFSDPQFFKVLEPIDGIIELLEKLHNNGHRIIICTCHNPLGIYEKDKWIQKHLPFVDEVIYKRLLPNHKINKSNIIGDIIIDDSIDALESNPSKYKICFGDYAYNKYHQGMRVCNAELLAYYIQGIINLEEV